MFSIQSCRNFEPEIIDKILSETLQTTQIKRSGSLMCSIDMVDG